MTSRQIYYAVYGRRPPRRRPRRRYRKGPARSPRYRTWIRTFPCDGCGTTEDVEAAHTGSDGGAKQKASDFSCIPLCTNCHTMAPDSYHRLGRREFERRRGIDVERRVRELNAEWFARRTGKRVYDSSLSGQG